MLRSERKREKVVERPMTSGREREKKNNEREKMIIINKERGRAGSDGPTGRRRPVGATITDGAADPEPPTFFLAFIVSRPIVSRVASIKHHLCVCFPHTHTSHALSLFPFSSSSKCFEKTRGHTRRHLGCRTARGALPI